MTEQSKDTQGPVIRCMNVKYSPNLGDGLLSECLEAGLIRHGASRASSSIDLAGRDAYGQVMAGRGKIMAALDAMPDLLRSYAIRLPLAIQSQRKWGPHYADLLQGADAVAIGGGNLLSDHDLNFPTKLALALQHASARGLRTALYACGMADHWTPEGERRVRNAVSGGQLSGVFLRDTASAERWNTRFAEVSGQQAVVVRDPGLLACDTYGPGTKDGGSPVIGIGVMSHVAIRYHATARITASDLSDWYADLARHLVAQGARVIAFTNGAPEDREVCDQLAPRFRDLGDAVAIRQPETPEELSAVVAGCDAIVAYRMHAVIAAYSHAVPAIALKWDDKLDAFMASVDRLDWLRDPADLSADAAAQLAMTAARDGLDPAAHATVIDEARADVGRLFSVLK